MTLDLRLKTFTQTSRADSNCRMGFCRPQPILSVTRLYKKNYLITLTRETGEPGITYLSPYENGAGVSTLRLVLKSKH